MSRESRVTAGAILLPAAFFLSVLVLGIGLLRIPRNEKQEI